jgi:hypothetical protein
VSERKTDDATLIEALRILARTLTTEDGVIPACLSEAADRLAELVEERRWVPVAERLPEEGVEVLCLIQPECACVGYQTRVFGQVVWNDEGALFRPTHWMPLPPGPEANGKTELPTD